MKNGNKTKDELMAELAALRQRNQELEQTVTKLQYQETALQQVIKHNPNATAIFDTQMRYIAVSDQFIKDYKVVRQEIIGQGHYDIFPEIPQRWRDIHSRVLQGEVIRAEADLFVRENGTVTYNNWECRPWYDEEDEIGGVIMYTEVITEHKELEQDYERLLNRLEEEVDLRTRDSAIFRTLTENALDAIVIADLEAHITYANRAAHDLFGCDYSQQEMINQPGTKYWPVEDIPRLTETVLPQALAGGWQGHVRQRRQDGQIFEANASVFPLYGHDNQQFGIGLIIRDITAQQQVAQTLRDSQQRMADIINFLPDATFVIDTEGRIIAWNRAIEQMTGLVAKDMLGKNNYEYALPFYGERRPVLLDVALQISRKPELVDMYDNIKHQGDNFISEAYMPHMGEGIYLIATAAVLYNADGEAVGAIEILRDFTERKQAEEEQAKLRQEIIEAQRQAIQELSTPVIPVMSGIIVMPLIGNIDSQRAGDLMRTLLAGISEHRAKVVILDITGVPIVDTGIAGHLDKTIQAARLKGARTIITGMSDAVAETFVDLGIDWSRVETLRDLQTGLEVALKNVGLKLC